MKLNDIDIFSILISALCHDIKHTGQTNSFHINNKSELATVYNGKINNIKI
jgi:HD superfamily phosphodiesterase